MRPRRKWRRSHVPHAIRVAVFSTMVIAVVYVSVVTAFDVVDRGRLVAHVDARLHDRLDAAVRDPSAAGAIDNYDNAHDVDDAPVYLWQMGSTGVLTGLTPGAPPLTRLIWSPSHPLTVARIGDEYLALQARRVGTRWFVAGQSLAEANHVESDLLALELLAGPILLLGVFLGTFLIGLKAAGPVELARLRQLEFTADASHELRTPLSVIEAEVSLTLSSPRTAEHYRQTLTRVDRECQRLSDIVEDLLWLSRFDSQPPPPSDEPVDVSEVAAACADRFSAVARRRGITLSLRRDGGGPAWIAAPSEWIDRLTAVLVDNACRYAGDGGTVEITVTVTANRIALAVDDSGPGIAPEARQRLFDRFHRATDEGNGAGLGLAIADSVAGATGGEWQVGKAALGGAHMEVRWHRAPAAKGTGPPRDEIASPWRNDPAPSWREVRL